MITFLDWDGDGLKLAQFTCGQYCSEFYFLKDVRSKVILCLLYQPAEVQTSQQSTTLFPLWKFLGLQHSSDGFVKDLLESLLYEC